METENIDYGTAEELKFIKGLGTYALLTTGDNAKSLLYKYILALNKRKKFDGIDRNEIFNAAATRLNLLSNGETK